MKGNLHWLLLVASFVARASATEPTFRLVNSTTLWSGRFVGAVTVGDGRVVLAPAAAGCVGVFDPSDAFPSSEFPSFSCVSHASIATGAGKYNGGALLHFGRVLFVPHTASTVGLFNITDGVFETVDITGVVGTGTLHFAGAATAVDGRVVFAPARSTGVGVRPCFQHVHAGEHHRRQRGQREVPRRRVGGRRTRCVLYFPNPNTVCRLSRVITRTHDERTDHFSFLFSVVFAPRDANGVGVFDPRDGADTFVLIDISDTYAGPAAGVKYMGAATASDGRVVFAPYYATGVRVFDPVHDTFTSVPIASKMSPTGTPSIHQFNSAATMSDGRVVFGPRHANGVGVFRPAKRYVRVGGHQPRDWY
jgi:hypothetical protein